MSEQEERLAAYIDQTYGDAADDRLADQLADVMLDEIAEILVDDSRSADDQLAALCSLIDWHGRTAGAA